MTPMSRALSFCNLKCNYVTWIMILSLVFIYWNRREGCRVHENAREEKCAIWKTNCVFTLMIDWICYASGVSSDGKINVVFLKEDRNQRKSNEMYCLLSSAHVTTLLYVINTQKYSSFVVPTQLAQIHRSEMFFCHLGGRNIFYLLAVFIPPCQQGTV